MERYQIPADRGEISAHRWRIDDLSTGRATERQGDGATRNRALSPPRWRLSRRLASCVCRRVFAGKMRMPPRRRARRSRPTGLRPPLLPLPGVLESWSFPGGLARAPKLRNSPQRKQQGTPTSFSSRGAPGRIRTDVCGGQPRRKHYAAVAGRTLPDADGCLWWATEAKLSDTTPIRALAAMQKATGAAHAFQIVRDLPYVDADAFSHTDPVSVSARTLLSQLF